MQICIPVTEDRGLDSPVCAHFGSAPFFLIVDVDAGSCRVIANRHVHHEHGHCQPLQALRGENIGAVVVGGIGLGALNQLASAGVTVFRAAHETAVQTVRAFEAGELRVMRPDAACAQHRH